jgi:hypothetical protein
MRFNSKQMKRERRKAVASHRSSRKLVTILALVAGFMAGVPAGHFYLAKAIDWWQTSVVVLNPPGIPVKSHQVAN